MAVEPRELEQKAGAYLPADKLRLVLAAYDYAAQQHQHHSRLSGEPYIQHPLHTALFLAELHLDASTLAASLLHDVIEDCGVTKEELAERFGEEVAKLVDGVTKLSHLDLLISSDGKHISEDRRQAGSLRKMLLAMAEDIRVVLIKLADRLHNMRTLDYLSPERQLVKAQETLDIYAPLAHRLGIWDIKWELEDLAFRYLYPDDYNELVQMLAAKREEREEYIARTCALVKDALQRAQLTCEVYGRPKHLYSIYQKAKRYIDQGKQVDEIYDLYALRIIVETNADCYNTLGVVHNLWRPIPGQFDDYITNSKDNLYQSLHTTVMCDGVVPLEIQIRTREMHQIAERGVAAHWRYKEGGDGDPRFEEKLAWVRQLLEWQREVTGAEEFLESVKTDIFQDQVFIYTPKGAIKELPTGSTPIDFAYHIHTELGHRCIGAKVNGRFVVLDIELQNGDTVEIVTSKREHGPSLDWLNVELGYVRTTTARRSIRQWFRRQERGANVERGNAILSKELKRLELNLNEGEVASLCKFDSAEELLVALGSGNFSPLQVSSCLVPQVEEITFLAAEKLPPESPASGVQVLGVGDLLTTLARCCRPLPGEEITGFITRSLGVTIHRVGCASIKNEDEPEQLVRVVWGPSKQLYPVLLRIVSRDRVGLVRDISTLVAAEKVSIAGSTVISEKDGTAIITLTLYTTGTPQLRRLFARLEGVKGVFSVARGDINSSSS